LCPLQRLERLHRLPLDVTVAWRASRGVTVFFRGLRRSARRTRFWLRALPPCPCPCGPGLRGVPRQDPHLGRKLEMDPLVKFGSPSEYCRGTPPETVLHRTTARRLAPTARALHLSWGSSSLRRSCSRCPVLPRPSSRRPREMRNSTSSPVPPSGFLNPSAVSAATTHVNPSCPGPTRYAVATPGTFAALFHAADAPGICPSELSLLGEPRHLPVARASLRVRYRPLIRHESPGDLRPVSPAPPARAAVAPLRALWRQR